MTSGYKVAFPAIRGIQAGREYFVSMFPLRLLSKFFLFNEEELTPEIRAQRQLNRGRIPEITRYIANNKQSYVFSAITVSVDSNLNFEQISKDAEEEHLGILHIPMSAKFVINDGQHRRAAIERALEENPDLSDETIAVVIFLDQGLERSQQMFADLNRYAIRPSKSLGVLYDHRDDKAELARMVVMKLPLFRDVVELERSSLSPRSRKLFTLSAIYYSSAELLNNLEIESPEEKAKVAVEFWKETAKNIKEWDLVREGKITSGEIRNDFIHSHGVVLQALGRVGNALHHHHFNDWKKRYRPIRTLDWRRANASVWEGRAMVGGRISKAQQNVILTTNTIKRHLDLGLTPEEQRIEDAHKRGSYDREKAP